MTEAGVNGAAIPMLPKKLAKKPVRLDPILFIIARGLEKRFGKKSG